MIEHAEYVECETTSDHELPTPNHSRRRWIGLAAAAAVAALTVGVVGLLATHPSTNPFPLESPDFTFGTSELKKGDARFSLASLHIEDPGKDVQIVDVKARMSHNVEFLGAYTMWPGKLYPHTGGPFFPIPAQKYRHSIDEVVPASEFRAATERSGRKSSMTVAVGFRVVSGDVGAVNGVLVTYRVGGKTKHQYFSQAVVGCIKPNPCKGDVGEDYSGGVLRAFGLVPALFRH